MSEAMPARPGPTPASAPPSATAAGHRLRLAPFLKIAAGVAVLVGVGIALKLIISPGTPPKCLYSCSSPPVGAIQPQGQTFTSSTYGFSFDYPSGAQPFTPNGAGVEGLNFNDPSGNFGGQMLVAAGSGATSLDGLISSEANALSGSTVTNLQPAGPMNGAEIGFTPGQGEMYTGQFTDPSGNVLPVDIGVVAVQRANEWVYLVGISGLSASSNTPVFFADFDDVLDRWRWSG